MCNLRIEHNAVITASQEKEKERMAAVEFGLMLRPNDPHYSLGELMDFNLRCIEALTAGFTTLWLEDHLQWEDGSDSLECFSTLCYLAGQFPRFKVGSMVFSQSYRNPALLAKMAANLQQLSGGRVILGLGAGWKEEEYHAYGYPFPSTKTRMEQLEEAAQILKTMWTSKPASFKGQHYTIKDAYCAPQPSPSIPLLIGGGGEQRTLAIVARYADMWNFNSVPVEEYARKADVLKAHCDTIGRDYQEIGLTYLSTLSVAEDASKVQRNPNKHFIAGNTDEVTRELQQFQAIGVKHFMFRILDVESLEHFVKHIASNFV